VTKSPTLVAEAANLRAVDAAARRILELAAPLRLEVAHRAADLEAIYRLRFQVASEMGWIESKDASDGLEKDAYDHDAVHVGAWDSERLVGTQRIVFPAPGRRLPLEDAFGLEIEPRGQVVHADRTAIARSHRGDRRHVPLAALMSRSWLESRARGFHQCTGILTDPVLRVYRDVGLEVEILGEAREYCGEPRFPARFNILAAADRLTERWGGDADEHGPS
jgi:N-acyl-L-homoserine lactone synthetase